MNDSKKIHILQLGPYPPPRGGVQTNMLAIRDELLRQNFDCSIISITRSETKNSEQGVYHPNNPLEFLRCLFSIKYDILHLHIGGELTFRVLMLILICSIHARGKAFMTFHSGGYTRKKHHTARYWTLRGFVFRRLNKIIVVNNLMIKMFYHFGVKNENIKLIPPFVLSHPKPETEIPAKFQKFRATHDKILLSVGALEEHYDLEMQINALEKILQNFPKTGLVIIGSGSLENDLRELIAAKTYAENILLAGDTEREIVLHLIENADVLLRTTIFDGDAISIREAIFLGTPVIATDNGMRPPKVKLIPKRDQNALVAKVKEQLQLEKNEPKSEEDGWKHIRKVVKIYKHILSINESETEESKIYTNLNSNRNAHTKLRKTKCAELTE